MKKLFTLLAVVFISSNTWSYDFSAINPYGKTIYYNIASADDKTVEVTSKGENTYSGEINIPSFVNYEGTTYSVTSIGSRAFLKCTGLTFVTIPESVIIVGDYAFSTCTGLTSVTIPNPATRIENYAFQSCWRLTSITIHASAIWYNAFVFCTGLTKIHSLSSTPPPTLNSFDYVPSRILLYVPTGSKVAYQSSEEWNRFNIIETDFTGVETETATDALQINAIGESLYIGGVKSGETIRIFSASGILLYSGISTGGVNIIPIKANGVLIVKSGETIVKVNR